MGDDLLLSALRNRLRHKARRGTRAGPDESALVAQLGRIANTLNELARVAQTSGRLRSEVLLREAVDALLAVVRRVD